MYATDTIKTSGEDLKITFLGHGTLMLTFGSMVLHVDPVSDMADYSMLPAKADIIVVTHEHYDHCDTKAVEMLRKEGTVIIASESCTQQIGDCIVMKTTRSKQFGDYSLRQFLPIISFTCVPRATPFIPRAWVMAMLLPLMIQRCMSLLILKIFLK